jgi:hypothetical protein
MDHDEERFKAELNELEIRERKLKDEEAKLLQERMVLDKSSKELSRQAGEEGKNSEYISMMMDLYLTLISDGDKIKKPRKEINPGRELTEGLKV